MTLQELRIQNKKSRQAVAEKLGVTPNAVTNYECGIRSINIEQILQLSELYETSAEEVIKAQLNSCQNAPVNNRQKLQKNHTVIRR